MYTLISHGSRIQVARFQNASDVFHGPDAEVSNTPKKEETMKGGEINPFNPEAIGKARQISTTAELKDIGNQGDPASDMLKQFSQLDGTRSPERPPNIMPTHLG